MTEFERSAPRRRRFRRSVVSVVAAVAALGLAACEPPQPPDGRDLGISFTADLPTAAVPGEQLQIDGTLTNHGSVAADGVTLSYAVAPGFTVDDVSVSGSDVSCAPVSAQRITCDLAEALLPGATRSFTMASTAGPDAGSYLHLIAAGSAGSEPTPDPNPGAALFSVAVSGAPTPVAIGGGRNHLGTGHLLGAAGLPAANEGIHLSVSPYCTAKVNGDRFQAGYVSGACSGPVNGEYRAAGYTYVIDVPADRTSTVQVLLWDARYNPAALAGGEPGIDRQSQAGTEPFTYTLYSADSSPANDADNPMMCQQTFAPDSPFGLSYLGSERWNTLCTIPTSAPSGRYLLRVRNAGQVTSPRADGSNQFGVVARYASQGTGPGSLCEAASDPICPVVSGPGEASISVEVTETVLRLPLGRVPAEATGRTLRLPMFDPGDGGNTIRLLAPTGPGTWAAVPFAWSLDDGRSGSGTSLDVRNQIFNGRLVTLSVDLEGYQPPPTNELWKVEYLVAGGALADRTTWQAEVVDTPPPTT